MTTRLATVIRATTHVTTQATTHVTTQATTHVTTQATTHVTTQLYLATAICVHFLISAFNCL